MFYCESMRSLPTFDHEMLFSMTQSVSTSAIRSASTLHTIKSSRLEGLEHAAETFTALIKEINIVYTITLTILVSHYIFYILRSFLAQDDECKQNQIVEERNDALDDESECKELQSKIENLLSKVHYLEQANAEKENQVEILKKQGQKAHSTHQVALKKLTADKDAQRAEVERHYQAQLHRTKEECLAHKTQVAKLQRRISSLSAEKATEIVKLYATNSAVIEKLRSNYEFIVAELKRNLEDNHEKLKQMRINYDNAVEQHEQYLKRQLQTETISHCGISEQNIQNLPANIGLQSSPAETFCSMPEPYTRTELMMDLSNFESPVGIHMLEKNHHFDVSTQSETEKQKNNKNSEQIEAQTGISTVTLNSEIEVSFNTLFNIEADKYTIVIKSFLLYWLLDQGN